MKTLFFALVFAACAPRTELVATPAPALAQPQGQTNGLKLWANTALFTTAPTDLDVYVTAFGVDIENTSDKPVPLRLEDIRLVDNQGRRTAPFFMPERPMQCADFVTNGVQENEMGQADMTNDMPEMTGQGSRFGGVPVRTCRYPPVNVAELRMRLRKNPPKTGDLENRADGKPTSVFIRGVRRGGLIGANAWYDHTGQVSQPPGDWREEVRFLGAKPELATYALSEQILPPGARVTGFLFFPHLLDGARKVVLAWKPPGAKELLAQFSLLER